MRAALRLLALVAFAQPFPEIHWRFAPATLRLGDAAELPLPRGLIYAQDWEMRRFLEATGNSLSGREVAVVGPTDLNWFAVISLDPLRPDQRNERMSWTENNREADGREVVIQTELIPCDRTVVKFEFVVESARHRQSLAAFQALLAGLKPVPANEKRQPPFWKDWRLRIAISISLAAVLLQLRRRQRGL